MTCEFLREILVSNLGTEMKNFDILLKYPVSAPRARNIIHLFRRNLKQQTMMKSDDEMKMREWNKARTKPLQFLEPGPGGGG
jgi:hypothetical protein